MLIGLSEHLQCFITKVNIIIQTQIETSFFLIYSMNTIIWGITGYFLRFECVRYNLKGYIIGCLVFVGKKIM